MYGYRTDGGADRGAGIGADGRSDSRSDGGVAGGANSSGRFESKAFKLSNCQSVKPWAMAISR